MRTRAEIHDILVKFIEDEKVHNKMAYSYTLVDLEQLLNEIYKEYIEIMKKENEEEK